MRLTQGLARAAAVNPRGRATVHRGASRTWEEVAARVARLAAGLRGLGLDPGDRVGVLALNSDRHLETLFAIPFAGLAAVPLNWRLTPEELRLILEDSGARVVVTDAASLPLARAVAPRPAAWTRTVLIGDHEAAADPAAPDPRAIGYEALIAGSAPMQDAGAGGSDLAGLYYTAGTTSASKGVMLTHDNLVTNALSTAHAMSYDDRATYLHSGPMFHQADGASTFALTLAAGCHAFAPRFDPAECLATLAAERVTHAQFVPTMIKMLLDRPEIGTLDLSALRTILYGASPIEDETLRRAVTLLPRCGFVHGYGMTEVSSTATILPARYGVLDGAAAEKRRSCGQAALLCEIRVAGPEGEALPPGDVGEVLIRGPNVMAGYWNRPDETAAALRHGWMHSGDLGWLDADGFLFLAGRLKDMIKTGGENVFAIEVENVVADFPGVAEVAVIGLPHPVWTETVHAVVVPRAGAAVDPEALMAFCRDRMAAYKAPRSVEIRAEPLPLSAAGKILKRVLRDEIAGRAAD